VYQLDFEFSADKELLAARMAGYWTNFAKNGNPNGPGLESWSPFTASAENIKVLDEPAGDLVGYHHTECTFLDQGPQPLLGNIGLHPAHDGTLTKSASGRCQAPGAVGPFRCDSPVAGFLHGILGRFVNGGLWGLGRSPGTLGAGVQWHPCGPSDAQELVERQRQLAGLEPEPWSPDVHELGAGGCWVCFPRGDSGPGHAGDVAWSAAALLQGGRILARRVAPGVARAGYVPGMLALRLGPLLEQVVRLLPQPPEVLLVDGTGRDHPPRAGLAFHLGAELDVPT
jgi:hypothetical protein